MPASVFVTGGTGYMGSRLIPLLLERGHKVRALTRESSKSNLPAGCEPIIGDALKEQTFADKIAPADTFVQLVGVAHPGPSKAKQFREIDLVSARASISAATKSQLRHFIYVSVAHPAPAMKAYIEVRTEGEAILRASGMNGTVLRPWYVLGPGHRWPYLLIPFYWICERLPSSRESARRLGLVTLDQMLAALVRAVKTPVTGIRIVEVPEIRQSAK